MPEPSFEGVGSLRGWRSAGPGAVLLELEHATAWLGLDRAGCLRLRAAPGKALAEDPAEALARTAWRAASSKPIARDSGGLRLGYDGPEGSAEVEVEASPFRVSLRDGAGGPVAALEGLAFAPEGRGQIALRAEPGERFFGFGEKFGGLDKRGMRLRMRNRDANLRLNADPLYVSIPFFLGLRGGRAHGVLLEAVAPSSFDVAKTDPDRVSMQTLAGGIDVTLFPGPQPRDVLRRFTGHVGRSPLPPLWALGHHQSRWSYRTAREVRRVARELRQRAIPTDVIHLDIDHMDGFRVFSWNPKSFPDPEALLRELAAEGLRVVVIVDPGVKVDADWPVFREAEERGLLCRRDDGSLYTLRVWPGRAALPDFNRPEVREWWGKCHRGHLDTGVAGIWNDMNEPAGWSADVRLGRYMLPLRAQDTSDMLQADPVAPERSVPHEHVRNLYGQQHARATREFLEQAAPGRRPFVLTRSGYAGIQRWAAVWTGDNASTWAQLQLSVPMLLGLSVSGVPFCGADIGGFAFSCTPELYARWIQIGALYPFARTHTMFATRRQEPWSFGSRVEAIARDALRLRMRLLPYLYGLFREAERNGAPVWRPLFFEFPDDETGVAIDDQVLVGASLLVAPVLERGARSRRVYLPPGTWFSWHDDARYVGPCWLDATAPLETLPLFVRGGTILPTQSPVRHVGETPAEPAVLEVFPGADATLDWIEDDGETTAYRDGASAQTTVRLRDRAGGRLRLELGAREGAFAPPQRTLRIVVHGCSRPRAVRLDAAELPRREAVPGYVWSDGRVQVRLADDGGAHALEIEPAP